MPEVDERAAEQIAEVPAEAPAEVPAEEPSHSVPKETQVPEPHYGLSNQVHVLGFNTHARFIAHAFAGNPDLPEVQLMAHHASVISKWGDEGRSISLHDRTGLHLSSHEVPCPEWLGNTRQPLSLRQLQADKEMGYIDNLVVSTQSWAILPSLRRLRNRIDNRTTLCLLNPGLGLMEKLNEQVFDDWAKRPNYVLGHSSHTLSKHSYRVYSLMQRKKGGLFLYGVPRSHDSDFEAPVQDPARFEPGSPTNVGMQHTSHFLKLCSSSGELGVTAVPWDTLLTRKLIWMVYSSLADSISVVLGCRYSEIWHQENAMRLWNMLLEETMHIISQFPEYKQRPYFLKHLSGSRFASKLFRQLRKQGDAYSPWISWVRNGYEPPVDLINGYFVGRAKRLGLEHRYNSTVIRIVKSRHWGRRHELLNDIPLGLSPYMADHDRIGGGQDHDSELDVGIDELED
ncbi:hypothetical protein F4780DRAFT_748362 [Xylariomycetidae sp. FL0641]|nr:hypothetical protein F4780DRAFT_748362 [Xylariomycetidae sp. FL0641]